MADEQPPSPGWHLSNNGLQAVSLVVGALVTVATLFLQSHNQHVERMQQAEQFQAAQLDQSERHQAERIQRLKAIEDKLPGRRVFLEGP
jgi:hypothetical protein